jgi:predicted flap endonuclease-1-like 5' DNA nuclease
MWPLCNANPILWLLLPLLIGLLTGWWAFRKSSASYAYAVPEPAAAPVAAPVAAPRVAEPAPVAPAPVAAAPVAVAAAPAAKLVETPAAPKAAPVAPKVAAVPVAAAIAMTAIGIPAAVGKADDLLQIKGVGPKLNALLNSLGITRFDQIAKWGTSEVSKVDTHLGNFSGRIVRDSWVEQAGLLARGAIADFEAKFGKLDSENK